MAGQAATAGVHTAARAHSSNVQVAVRQQCVNKLLGEGAVGHGASATYVGLPLQCCCHLELVLQLRHLLLQLLVGGRQGVVWRQLPQLLLLLSSSLAARLLGAGESTRAVRRAASVGGVSCAWLCAELAQSPSICKQANSAGLATPALAGPWPLHASLQGCNRLPAAARLGAPPTSMASSRAASASSPAAARACSASSTVLSSAR